MRNTLVLVALAGGLASTAAADVVYQTGTPNGWLNAFNSGSTPGKRIGDSGWLGFGPASTLNQINLVLSLTGSSGPGSTDITFTFNNGDPSGLVFGSGATLYSTTITNVLLPDSSDETVFFSLNIPLPNIVTDGFFNNVGWSIGVQNFNYSGSLGAQTTSAPNAVGFYTNVASQYDPGTLGWWTYDFFPSQPANFAATIFAIPAPSAAGLLAFAGLAAARRRR
jgi:hypothetical protein